MIDARLFAASLHGWNGMPMFVCMQASYSGTYYSYLVAELIAKSLWAK